MFMVLSFLTDDSKKSWGMERSIEWGQISGRGAAILVAHKVFTTPILMETGRVPLKKPVCTNFEKVLLP